MTMLTTVFYLRTSNRLALCVGHSNEYLVTLEKGGSTSCSAVRASAARNDLLTTLALVAINMTAVGSLLYIAARSKLLEVANAPDSAASAWLPKKAARRIVRICGCIPPPPVAAPAIDSPRSPRLAPASVSPQLLKQSSGFMAMPLTRNPLLAHAKRAGSEPRLAPTAAADAPPAADTVSIAVPQPRPSLQRVPSTPRDSSAFVPMRVASKKRESLAVVTKEAFEPVTSANGNREPA